MRTWKGREIMKYLVGGFIGSLLTVGFSCGYILFMQVYRKEGYNEW